MNDFPAKAPEDCQDMADVREGVDATDRALVELLSQRFSYMRAAARIKQTRQSVRDEERKAAVIKAVVDDASARDLPPEVFADMWERLVEGSIAYEFVEWDRIRD